MDLMEALLHDRQLGLVPESAGPLAALELYAADFVNFPPTITQGSFDGWERAITG